MAEHRIQGRFTLIQGRFMEMCRAVSIVGVTGLEFEIGGYEIMNNRAAFNGGGHCLGSHRDEIARYLTNLLRWLVKLPRPAESQSGTNPFLIGLGCEAARPYRKRRPTLPGSSEASAARTS